MPEGHSLHDIVTSLNPKGNKNFEEMAYSFYHLSVALIEIETIPLIQENPIFVDLKRIAMRSFEFMQSSTKNQLKNLDYYKEELDSLVPGLVEKFRNAYSDLEKKQDPTLTRLIDIFKIYLQKIVLGKVNLKERAGARLLKLDIDAQKREARDRLGELEMILQTEPELEEVKSESESEPEEENTDHQNLMVTRKVSCETIESVLKVFSDNQEILPREKRRHEEIIRENEVELSKAARIDTINKLKMELMILHDLQNGSIREKTIKLDEFNQLGEEILVQLENLWKSQAKYVLRAANYINTFIRHPSLKEKLNSYIKQKDLINKLEHDKRENKDKLISEVKTIEHSSAACEQLGQAITENNAAIILIYVPADLLRKQIEKSQENIILRVLLLIFSSQYRELKENLTAAVASLKEYERTREITYLRGALDIINVCITSTSVRSRFPCIQNKLIRKVTDLMRYRDTFFRTPTHVELNEFCRSTDGMAIVP